MGRRDNDIEAAWGAYAQRLATALRRAREASGLSQEDVAYRAGLTRYTYQKYEKGESRPGSPANPTLRTILAISQVLGTSLSELLPDKAPDLRSR
ncbi:helix-turn-helix domain-containing protein [Microbacterium arborescens]|uniref:helix-turn-helix domain-containing protein n=1 Tax=Microbacterium arborescens TaxID=33883 RepID=UPI0025A18B9B|nr:helix-turn-helix transcriptional regulator [Microbacterium arborescens]WJM17154.1 helix-turn-helix transcriptional regulator [Microbacterium arborescens]